MAASLAALRTSFSAGFSPCTGRPNEPYPVDLTPLFGLPSGLSLCRDHKTTGQHQPLTAHAETRNPERSTRTLMLLTGVATESCTLRDLDGWHPESWGPQVASCPTWGRPLYGVESARSARLLYGAGFWTAQLAVGLRPVFA